LKKTTTAGSRCYSAQSINGILPLKKTTTAGSRCYSAQSINGILPLKKTTTAGSRCYSAQSINGILPLKKTTTAGSRCYSAQSINGGLRVKPAMTVGMSLLLLPFFSTTLAAQQRPNIVVILADDLASHELSCYGGKNVQTPNIDRLAREGIRFTNCFTSTSMSAPVRTALYTGLYPVRNGTYKNHQPSRPDIESITKYLPDNGYQVWRTGKSHTNPRSVYTFDEIPGFEVDCTNETAFYFTDSIEQRIRQAHNPFCLFVCSTNPHAPWTMGDPSVFDPEKLILPPHLPDSKEFREIYRTYLAEIKQLDDEVGAIWALLEQTGQLDNTLLMFLGEQGPQFPGGKWTCWDYGVHSAMIARYPSKIKRGSVSDILVQYEDVLPTFIDFIGGQAVSSLDGKSFLPALFGKKEECRPWVYGIHNNVPEGSAYPIRSIRDKRYHLIVNLTPEAEYLEKHVMNSKVWSCWMYGDAHAIAMANRYLHRPAVEFYDTKNDPWQLNNMASDPRYTKKIAEMRSALDQWMNEQGDRGIAMDVPIPNALRDKEIQQRREALRQHNRPVLIKDGWLRDPYITIGGDGYYYLMGTPPDPANPRSEEIHFYHIPVGQATTTAQSTVVTPKIYLWRSPDLADWEAFGMLYVLEEGFWGQKHPEVFEAGSPKAWFVWTPKMYFERGKWIFVHTTPDPYRNGAILSVSNGLINNSETDFPMGEDLFNKQSPSLFRDDDGVWYLIWANTLIAPLKPGFAGLSAAPTPIDNTNGTIGHDGATLRKIGKKYVLFGTAWLTDTGQKGSYDLYYCTADHVYGPYSQRQLVGKHLGHGTPFQDREGRWWCTAFFDPKEPLSINKQGITLVPLDVTILENGDITIEESGVRN